MRHLRLLAHVVEVARTGSIRKAAEQLNLVGFPLGIFDDVTYEEWSVILDPGDILVFHSDGLSEAPDPQGRQFGIPRLAAMIENAQRANFARNRRFDPLSTRVASTWFSCITVSCR